MNGTATVHLHIGTATGHLDKDDDVGEHVAAERHQGALVNLAQR